MPKTSDIGFISRVGKPYPRCAEAQQRRNNGATTAQQRRNNKLRINL
ncbi:MAG: hypothetical protein ACRC78_11895 [Planktothrix sp.]